MTGTDSSNLHEPSTKLPFRSKPFFYGWVITAVSALILFFSGPGQTYSVSIFIDSYITEFGWSRSVVSSMYSLGTLTAGLAMGVIGNLFDRVGHRIMTTLVALGLGIACFGMSFVNSLGMLFIGFLTLRLLGQGSMSLSGSTIVPQWFIVNKGKALSIASLGGAASLALLPVFNTWLIQQFSWQVGWRVWALLLWGIMTPISYLLIRNRPEDMNLLPDNREIAEPQDEANSELEDELAWTLEEAIHTRSFWLLLYCSMVPSAIITGLIFHQISVMAQLGLSAMIAALVLSSMAVVRPPFVLVAGPLADRIPVRYLLALSQVILFFSIIALLFATSIILALVYGLLVGVLISFNNIARGVVWPDYYGRRHLGSIRGVSMVAGVIGSALGPLPFGIAFDLFGGYTQILFLSLGFPLLGIIAALLATPPKKPKQ